MTEKRNHEFFGFCFVPQQTDMNIQEYCIKKKKKKTTIAERCTNFLFIFKRKTNIYT